MYKENQRRPFTWLTVVKVVWYLFVTYLFVFKTWGNDLFNYLDKFIWFFLIAIEPVRMFLKEQAKKEAMMEEVYRKLDQNIPDSPCRREKPGNR